jgi:phage terminase large subunit
MSKIKLIGKYKKLFTDDSRYFLVTGGRGSSKSFSVSTFLCLLMFYEKGHTILFTRYTLTSAESSIIPEFSEKIEILGLQDYFEITKNEIICKKTGSNILFQGLKTSTGQNTAKLKSLNNVTTWVLDEAEELIDEELFDKINLSVRKKGIQNRVILIMNPTTKEHWIYKRFFETPGIQPGINTQKNNTTYIHTTYEDNLEHLDQTFLDEVFLIKETNPKKYSHVILGGWLDKAEGVIFTNWEIGEFPQEQYGIGLDFGFSVDPTAAAKVIVDNKNKLVYVDEICYKTHMTTKDIADMLKKHVTNNLIVADLSEGRLIDELTKEHGLNVVKCKKGPNSIVEGIKLLEGFKMIISPTSINLIKELNNYIWNDRKSGTPIDMYNHLLDAIRYYVTTINVHQVELPNLGISVKNNNSRLTRKRKSYI